MAEASLGVEVSAGAVLLGSVVAGDVGDIDADIDAGEVADGVVDWDALVTRGGLAVPEAPLADASLSDSPLLEHAITESRPIVPSPRQLFLCDIQGSSSVRRVSVASQHGQAPPSGAVALTRETD